MDASELARWSRFAAKGGIGKCTAIRDCLAQTPEDLMFIQDEEIVVLMQLPTSDGIYLGFCEGVVGKFSGTDVKFHGKLKKPVLARLPGSVTASAHASSALAGYPLVSNPSPSDPSPSDLYLNKGDSDLEINTIKTIVDSESVLSTDSHFNGRDSPPYTREGGVTSEDHLQMKHLGVVDGPSTVQRWPLPSPRTTELSQHSHNVPQYSSRQWPMLPTSSQPMEWFPSRYENPHLTPLKQWDGPSQRFSGGRSIRLVLYGRISSEDVHTIWIDHRSSYGDIVEGLATMDATCTFTVLQPIWGPTPRWTESNPKSLIGSNCNVLYAVVKDDRRYIVGVVRGSLSDYPVALYESPTDPSRTVAQAIVALHPELKGQIKSITGLDKEQSVKQLTDQNFESVVIINTSDDPPKTFIVGPSQVLCSAYTHILVQAAISAASIPPLLRLPFAYCETLMKQAYDLEDFALQIIHLLRAIMHIINSLAKKTEAAFNHDSFDVETALLADDDTAAWLRATPILSRNLQEILDRVKKLMDNVTTASQKEMQKEIEKVFSVVCGDYPGAVDIRHSHNLFNKLVHIDHEEREAIRGADATGRSQHREVMQHDEEMNDPKTNRYVWNPDAAPERYPWSTPYQKTPSNHISMLDSISYSEIKSDDGEPGQQSVAVELAGTFKDKDAAQTLNTVTPHIGAALRGAEESGPGPKDEVTDWRMRKTTDPTRGRKESGRESFKFRMKPGPGDSDESVDEHRGRDLSDHAAASDKESPGPMKAKVVTQRSTSRQLLNELAQKHWGETQKKMLTMIYEPGRDQRWACKIKLVGSVIATSTEHRSKKDALEEASSFALVWFHENNYR